MAAARSSRTFGLAVVSRFRAIERAATSAAEQHIKALQAEIEAA